MFGIVREIRLFVRIVLQIVQLILVVIVGKSLLVVVGMMVVFRSLSTVCNVLSSVKFLPDLLRETNGDVFPVILRDHRW